MATSIDLEKKLPITAVQFSTSSIEDGNQVGSVSEVELFKIQRDLQPRILNIMCLGGSVGTALFITISSGLLYGGPLSLFLAFTIWSFIVFFVVVCMGEMVCYLPIEAPFIQMAGRCVDRSYEFVVGINYYLMTSIYIPFEITAVNGMIHYWRDDYSPAITFCIEILIYMSLNLLAVKFFGQSEFYLSIGKFILAISLIFFTFITMVGGNPQHDAFGFRYWREPGPMVETIATGSMGRFHGFLACMNKAALTIVGPEYIAMLAGETGGETRKVMARTFKSVIIRLMIFYICGALCVGILLPSDDPTLVSLASSGSTSNGAYSPYIIAMGNLNVKVFPHIVNSLCVTSAFSAGNSYVYCSSRALYGMADRGLVPKIFKKCTKNGIPIYCVGITFCFSLLALLQLSTNTAKVLNWMVNLATGAQLLNYFFMCITYLGFFYACKAQGIDKSSFRYKAWCQPYLTYFTAFVLSLMIGALGYTVFMPGSWSIENFLTYYVMILLAIFLFVVHKLIYKTRFVKSAEADLISGLEEIELHELTYLEEQEKSNYQKKWFDRVLDVIL